MIITARTAWTNTTINRDDRNTTVGFTDLTHQPLWCVGGVYVKNVETTLLTIAQLLASFWILVAYGFQRIRRLRQLLIEQHNYMLGRQ